MSTIYARKTDIQRAIEHGQATVTISAVKPFSDWVGLVETPEPAPAPKITADTPVDYGNDTIREHAAHLVRQNVHYCVSSLVDSLARTGSAADALGLDMEEVYAITSQEDWETPAREWINRADSEELRDAYEYAAIGTDAEPALPEDMGNDGAIAALLAILEETENWQDFCDYCCIESETREAYEHWIVSDWLAGQLESEGEIVARDFLGLTIWGRCTTGQSMSMDHVMLKIARDALIRE